MVYSIIKNNNKMSKNKHAITLDVNEEQKEMLIDLLAKMRNEDPEDVADNLDFHIVNSLLDRSREISHLLEIDEEEIDEIFSDYVEIEEEIEED